MAKAVLARTLNYLKEKATGSWISWDGGLFIANTEYSEFITDTKNQFLIVDGFFGAITWTPEQFTKGLELS